MWRGFNYVCIDFYFFPFFFGCLFFLFVSLVFFNEKALDMNVFRKATITSRLLMNWSANTFMDVEVREKWNTLTWRRIAFEAKTQWPLKFHLCSEDWWHGWLEKKALFVCFVLSLNKCTKSGNCEEDQRKHKVFSSPQTNRELCDSRYVLGGLQKKTDKGV